MIVLPFNKIMMDFLILKNANGLKNIDSEKTLQ